MSRMVLSLVIVLLAARAAVAEPPVLGDEAIKTAILGKLLAGTYSDGSRWQERYLVDGGLIYSDDNGIKRGEWRVVSSSLCTLYDTDLEGGCFIVASRGENCLDFYAVDPADARPQATEAEIATGTGWTARGWRSDRIATCPDGFDL